MGQLDCTYQCTLTMEGGFIFIELDIHTTNKENMLMLKLSMYLAQIYDIILAKYFDVNMHTKDTSS